MTHSAQQEEPNINETLGIEPGEEQEQEEQEAGEISPLTQEAMDGGWKDKDAFVEAGGDAEKHVSPHEFIRYGKLQKTLKEQQRRFEAKEQDYDQRFENLNKLHKVQLDQKITSLQAKQRAAVEDADSEAYDQAQTEINSLQEQQTTEVSTETTPNKDPLTIAWEEKNPWINDTNDPRAQAAQGFWGAYAQNSPNGNVAGALAYVDEQLAKLSPPQTNLRREQPSTTETNTRTNTRKRGLQMSDLTNDERDLWRNAGQSIWNGDEKAFLKSAADARK